MKNIIDYKDEKYCSGAYEEIERGIYKTGKNIVTSLCFQQEPELDEGMDSSDISQYPLEDILDRFNVYISDFYKEKNNRKSSECYLEFCGTKLEYIRGLRTIIGKHVYCKNKVTDGTEYVELVIE